MSPVEIAFVVACGLLLLVCAGAAVTMRQLSARTTALQSAVDRLCDQVEELSRREAAREAAEEAAAEQPAQEADWVITSVEDDEQQQRTVVPAQQVVSTALGEPLIKVAALSHGVRQALREERRAHLAFQVRREYRRRRRQTRARTRAARTSAARARAAQERTTQERTTQ
jgi:outer membrane murein-binding lipoprotein Lpp